MKKQYVFAGFGGQGMLLIGKFVAMANMLDGKHVSWLPSYGPEMRGGTANCSVIVSDEEVGSPMVNNADVLIAMNLPSLDKFEHTVKPGGLIVVNSSIIDRKVQRDDVKVVYCDAARIADEVKNPKGANVAILGAMMGADGARTMPLSASTRWSRRSASSWASARPASSRATRQLSWPAWKPQSKKASALRLRIIYRQASLPGAGDTKPYSPPKSLA